MPVKCYALVGHVIKKNPSLSEKTLPVKTDAQWKASVPRLTLGTLRSETRRLLRTQTIVRSLVECKNFVAQELLYHAIENPANQNAGKPLYT